MEAVMECDLKADRLPSRRGVTGDNGIGRVQVRIPQHRPGYLARPSAVGCAMAPTVLPRVRVYQQRGGPIHQRRHGHDRQGYAESRRAGQRAHEVGQGDAAQRAGEDEQRRGHRRLPSRKRPA